MGVDIAKVVHAGVLEAHLGQLSGQSLPQHLLFGGGGMDAGGGIGLGIEGDIAQETVEHGHIPHPFGESSLDGRGGLR